MLGIKLVGYRSFIKNYIHNVYGVWWRDGVVPTWASSNGFRFTIAHQNYQPIVKKSGAELELNYDMGRFLRMSLTLINVLISQPIMLMPAHVRIMLQKKTF